MSARSVIANEKGAALITALMLTTLSLIIATALLYSVMMGTRGSASQKRYTSVLSATHGGVELLASEIIPLFFSDRAFSVHKTKLDLLTAYQQKVGLQIPDDDCLAQKVNYPTSQWKLSDKCSGLADPVIKPDAVFRLEGLYPKSGYTIRTKIVDTVPGNSDKNSNDFLDQGTSVAGNEEGIRPQHVPALFNISVQGEGEGSSPEKAKLSVLYAY